jgi:hypothetical protein
VAFLAVAFMEDESPVCLRFQQKISLSVHMCPLVHVATSIHMGTDWVISSEIRICAEFAKEKIMTLVSTFEVLLKPQLPAIAGISKLSRKVIQGYFLTISNVNVIPVTLSVVFTLKFPSDPTNPGASPTSWEDFLQVVDISGQNLFSGGSPQATLEPEIVPENNKARVTFTLPKNGTGLLLLQPNILSSPDILETAEFEARGYVEIFLSSLSGSDTATLLVTPEQRGTFFKDPKGKTPDAVGLDQIAYALPVKNGGVFELSNG